MKKQDRKKDELMRDLFSRQEVFEPSSSFTGRVMYRISIEKSYDAEIYKPLISKTAWIIIAASVAVLIALPFLVGGGGTGNIQYLPDISFNLDFNLSWIASAADRMIGLFHNITPVADYIIFGLLAVCFILITELIFPHRLLRKN
jgi:hypothetical protein